jgi:DNA processing protein
VVRVLARNALLGRSNEEFLSLSAEAYREEYRLTAKAANALANDPAGAITRTLETEKRLAGLGVSLATAADAHYPWRVEAFDPDPPGVLFLYGNTALLESSTFAVLSSRNAPTSALNALEELTEAGVLGGEVLVSGHDRPEYQRSAVVPLRWGAPRILCLDRGLFPVLGPELRDEAFRAARLWRYQFDPTTDLVISPFRPEAEYVGANNRLRDRLVASLADRIDWVHMSEGGNMETLARMALKAGRAVRVSDRILGYRKWVELGAKTLET